MSCDITSDSARLEPGDAADISAGDAALLTLKSAVASDESICYCVFTVHFITNIEQLCASLSRVRAPAVSPSCTERSEGNGRTALS